MDFPSASISSEHYTTSMNTCKSLILLGYKLDMLLWLHWLSVFSPLAGLLTDTRFSRYKMVLCSSYFIIVAVLVLCAAIIVVVMFFPIQTIFPAILTSVLIMIDVVFVAVGSLFVLNSFQFGMDQLHDSPTEDFVLFIHWYVWIYYTCSLLAEATVNFFFYDSYKVTYFDVLGVLGFSCFGVALITTLTLLTVSVCVFHRRKVLFLLEPAGGNPYKLVYRVTSFAYHHKVPLRRSAFTYCTEELPSRMDVGKHKYGGPYTSKQVEDVKAFWGILKVLLLIGPAFLLQTASQAMHLPGMATSFSLTVQTKVMKFTWKE